jgi:hypothetical protein
MSPHTAILVVAIPIAVTVFATIIGIIFRPPRHRHNYTFQRDKDDFWFECYCGDRVPTLEEVEQKEGRP